jgi:two-component sensor histidine kinase
MNKIILLIVFIFSATGSRSQVITNLGLGVTDYKDHSIESLLQQLKEANGDTSKVKLLIRISSFYVYKRDPDSSLYFSSQAMKLAQKLQYNAGYFEACFLQCKTIANKGNVADAKTYLSLVPKDQQARLLLVLGEHFLFIPGEQKKNLDSAYGYFNSALALSEAIQNQHWKVESNVALGKYYFSAGEFNNGKESFMKVIRYYQAIKDKKTEARWWYDLALYMPDAESTYNDEVNAYQNALRLFSEVKDTSEIAEVMYDFAGIYMAHGKNDSTRQLLTTAIALLKKVQKKRVFKFYFSMSQNCLVMGDLNDAIFYGLETIKNMEENDEMTKIPVVEFHMGKIYASLNQHEQSLKYFLSAKDKIHSAWLYIAYFKVAEELIQLKRPQEALKILLDFESKSPPVRLDDRETIAGAKADCYNALHEYSLAEKQYLQMIFLDVLVQNNKKNVVSTVSTISGPEAYYKIGKFYVEQKKYAIANGYLNRSLQNASFDDRISYSTDLLRKIKWMQFKADSATGNYFSALQNFQQYTAINDSIFNSDKIKQAEKMRIAYESKEKEKNIQLLQKEKLIQQGSLNQTTLAKNVAVTGVFLLLIILGLLYRQFRLKQLNNRTISNKNEILNSLLTEKEWLLREVHHRVKNNLQIIISLLNTQSNYLESDAAVKAIRESQQRMYAVSLIHQKLYTAKDSAFINIREYVHELVEHIKNSLTSSLGIVFDLNIADAQMDVAQAVPLGLILNEAISNAVKYAFPGQIPGKVIITIIHSAADDNYLLVVADNGVGLPPDYDPSKKASLGVRLMQGLSKQLGGSFKIESNNGVRLEVAFAGSNIIKLVGKNRRREDFQNLKPDFAIQ